MDPATDIADQNTERLIQAAYQPDPVPPAFAADLEVKLTAQAQALAKQTTTLAPVRPRRWRRAVLMLGGLAACILIVYALSTYSWKSRDDLPKQRESDLPKQRELAKKPIDSDVPQPLPQANLAKWTDDVREGMMPRQRPDTPALAALQDGHTLATKAGQRRLVQLGDGTRLYVNEKTKIEATGPRQLTLHTGQIYLEVAPLDNGPRFVVKAANREITATGTHFAVQSDPVSPGLVVTQGKVAVKGIPQEVAAGQQIALGTFNVAAAPRASHTLQWTRALMAAAETPMVPACQHAGGALLALDPQGQEIKLSLRQYHIDVHIEDGFARTTIDQTYFNTTWERLEGTFYFPLPADASLSRLAMYVVDGNQCKLMEGGMAERKHAADVYETIRYQRRDPALLEWLDGSTFKMRVFPLEAKQEKRIVLSYTQKLPTLYGTTRYRFAGGHNMPIVREWSFNARIKSGAGMNVWTPAQADTQIIPQGGDTLVRHFANHVKPEADVAIEMQDKNAAIEQDQPRFASFLHENHQYLMLRYRPTLASLPERQRRDWIVLFESSAQRDPLLAGTQVDILRQILKNTEYDDTFTLITANSKVQIFNDKAQPARPKNVEEALKFLQSSHLVGALDLQQGLQTALKFAKDAKNPHLLHIGAGIPAMGERDAGKLAKVLPESVRYVGVGVGKRWNRAFMKAAAERTNGMFTQINPDEVISWRAFELLGTLNTPRLLDVQVVDANGKARFLMETSMIAQGEELCAITRVDTSQTALPGKVIVKGMLDGKAMVKEFPVMNVLSGAGYLPRTWAKQEIDRLLADNSAQHKNEIISLSKAMYVMSPFTSLLVLETDADYERFKVDKGRKDHWAMYQCPPKIPLVYEPDGKPPVKKEEKKKDAKPTVEEVLGTIVMRAGANRGRDGFTIVDVDPAAVEFDTDIQYMPDRIEAVSVPGSVNPDEPIGIKGGDRFDLPVNLPAPGGFGPGQGGAIEFFPPSLALKVRAKSGVHNSRTGGITGGKQKGGGDVKWREEEGMRRLLGEDEAQKDSLIRIIKRPVSPYLNLLRGGDPAINYYGLVRPQAEITKLRITDSQDRVGEVIIVGDGVTQDRVIRRSLGFNNGQTAIRGFKDLDGATGIPPDPFVGSGAAEMGDLMSDFIKRGKLQEAENLARKIREVDPDNLAAVAAIHIIRNRMEQGKHDRAVHANEAVFLQALDVGLGTYADMNWPVRFQQKAGPSLLYQRPQFDYDRTLFTDLVQYAPGLHNTRADILATLEAEADVVSPKLGGIDADARRLIERARSADWQSLTIPAEGPLPSYKIHYNGIGQFAYERILVSGLREQLICDGKTLWHLYPEIGLAAKRPFSRYHQNLAASIAPSLLPGAEELARGYDVKAVDSVTVALVPFWAAQLKKDEKYHGVHLVFANDGRLSERRIVEMPLGKIVLRQTFQAEGGVEWQDADGKSLAKQTRAVAPAQAPNLTPSVRELVVMSMPLRTHEHIIAQARKLGDKHEFDPDVVAQWFISECMRGNLDNNYRMGSFGKYLHSKGDHRLGFYTLINASGFVIDNKFLASDEGKNWSIDIEKEHPDNALAMHLAQSQREMKSSDQSLLKNVPGPKDGFVQRLAQFRNIWLTWQNQRPIANGADMPLEMAKTIDFLQDTPSPAFAYAVLDTMQRRCNKAPTDHMMDIVVKRLGPVSDPLGLGYVFRYEHARSLWQAGKAAEAARLFKDLHTGTLQHGMLPPIDSAFRDVLQMPVSGEPKFIGFNRKTLDDLLAKKRYSLAFQLAKQMEQLGDEALGDEILTTILAKAPPEERNGLTLVCVHVLAQRKNFVQADRLLVKLLEDKKLSQHADLWRWRAELTKSYGQTAASIACLEKALDLEYADLPELVNLESIREDYRSLLNHYQKIAEASASLEKTAPKAFLAKVIRTTDRWRLLDADAGEPSQLAGKILHALGEPDLAWDYWTTPIDLHPAESKPWLDLAETMKSAGDLDRADRAFGLAFEAEQTNPEILWKRAQNLVGMGQSDRARQLYRQIADGAWQERFAATVQQARGLAER